MKKNNTALIVLILLFSSICYSQDKKVDSLKNLLNNTENEIKKLSILESIISYSSDNGLIDKTVSYCHELVSIAKNTDSLSLQLLGYRCISESFILKGNFTEAEKFGLLSFNEKADIRDYLLGVNQLGRVYLDNSKVYKAIETFKKGVEKYESLGFNPKDFPMNQIYSNLGNAYNKIGNTEKGIENYIKSSEYASSTGNLNQKAYSNYIIGYSYMDLEQYEKAESYFKMVLKDSTKILYKYVNYCNHALGINYSRDGQLDKALIYNEKALAYFRGSGNKMYQWDVMINTAVVFKRLKKPDSTLYYANSAFALANQIGSELLITESKLTLSSAYFELGKFSKSKKILLDVTRDTINKKYISANSKLNIYERFARIYEELGNTELSYSYFKRYQRLNDSLKQIQIDSKFSDIETRYQTEKKEKENLQLKADKAEQAELLAQESKRKWQLGAGLLTALLTLVIFAFYYRRNKKQKEVIESLQKELHHRIKNNLSIIDTFIEVAKEEFDDQKFSLKLTELQNRIDSINEVHQQLYKNKDVTNLNLKNYIDTLSSNVSNSFSNNKVVIEKEVEDNLNLNADKSFPVGLIINEFLTNSYKYAFGDDGGKVKIKIKKTDSKYNLTLSDNGKGLPKDFNIKTSESFGLRIIKLLAEQLNGSFELNNTNGVVLNISFPK